MRRGNSSDLRSTAITVRSLVSGTISELREAVNEVQPITLVYLRYNGSQEVSGRHNLAICCDDD